MFSLYFGTEALVNYILSKREKILSRKIDSKTEEILLGTILLWIHQRNFPQIEWVLGFPIKDKYLYRYKGKTEISDEDVAAYLESNERMEATFDDVVVTEISGGRLGGGQAYQIKRFGVIPPQKTSEDLVALLSSLKKNQKTSTELVIFVKKFGKGVCVNSAARWLRENDSPFDRVTMLYFDCNPRGRVFVRITGLYPKRGFNTWGMNLLTSADPPKSRLFQYLQEPRFFNRIWKHEITDELKYRIANLSLVRKYIPDNSELSFYIR